MINPKARPCDEGAIRSVTATSDCVASSKPWVLAVTILASTMAYIDESVVNVALPAIERDLGTSVVVIQWLVNAYTLSLGALLLIGGAAGDQFGRRRIFVIGTAIFAVASVLCGFSANVTQLIAARAAQGVGAALLIPCSLAIIGATFEEAERGKAIGTWAGYSAIAAAVGPLLGGFVIDHSSWRWIFLINPFVALPTILIAVRHVPESRDPEAQPTIDWLGALLAFTGLGSVAFGLIAWPDSGGSDPAVIASLVAGTLLLIAFVWVEARLRAPMMPLTLFRSPTFTGVNLLTLLLYAALGGAFFFLPFDLIQVHGYSATLAGAVFLPFTIIVGGLSRWSGGLLDRFGARLPLIVGPVIAAAGFALLALPGPGGSYWTTFLPPIVVLALGMAVTVAPLTTSVINAVPARQAGTASGVNNAVASVANLLAVAILGAIALGTFNLALDRHLAEPTLSRDVRQTVEAARGKFVTDAGLPISAGEDREIANAIIKESLADSIRAVMLLAAALALLGAACAALTIRTDPGPPKA
jgi:EmrB/QacA subfamily drug resistance transporter